MAASKYGNRKVFVDGIKFDSVAESKYYEQLKWLKHAKQIKGFKLQPRFVILDPYKKNGKTVRAVHHVADFEIHNLDGSIEIVDVKGHETKDFLLKKKLFEHRYEHTLKVVTLDDSFGWIELDQLKKLRRRIKQKSKSITKRRQ